MNKNIAEFAAELTFDNLPQPVIRVLKYSFIDAIACALYGSTKSWSKILRDVVLEDESTGQCAPPSIPNTNLPASSAALLLGAYCHAFEQDNLRFPGAGVHPGATIMCPLLALTQQHKLSGKQLLVSAAAGLEAMSRLGVATKHSLERQGFHAPGVIGPVGGAIACASALGAGPRQILNACGIAASMSSGLLAFSKSEGGGMIKRFHLGRSAEAAVRAAQLAMKGFEGPETAIDGQFGLLEAFCPEYDKDALDEALGGRWESLSICFKTFPIHITAHGPLMAALELMNEHEFAPADITKVIIFGSKKIASHHDIKYPSDIMQAQYSVPFCVAAGLVIDLRDPNNFSDNLLKEQSIQQLVKKIKVCEIKKDAKHSWHSRVSIELKDGQKLHKDAVQFRGMPSKPMRDVEISDKFWTLTKGVKGSEKFLSAFLQLETLKQLPDLKFFIVS